MLVFVSVVGQTQRRSDTLYCFPNVFLLEDQVAQKYFLIK